MSNLLESAIKSWSEISESQYISEDSKTNISSTMDHTIIATHNVLDSIMMWTTLVVITIATMSLITICGLLTNREELRMNILASTRNISLVLPQTHHANHSRATDVANSTTRI